MSNLILQRALERAYRYILRMEDHPKDWACKQCVPHSDMLKEGFVCVYHEAENYVGDKKMPKAELSS